MRKSLSGPVRFLLLLCVLLLVSASALADGDTDKFGNKIVHNPDGSITVVTNDENPLAGKVVLEEDNKDESNSVPMSKADWQALLDSVAARNGAHTPTWYTDPATGTKTGIEVVYMGIGRTMIELNGEKVLVPTANLTWETEAPEDKVLAVVRAPRVGYAWLRKAPSSDKKNLKIEQVRTDSVLRVLGTGKNWTFVDYNGMRAYIMTDSLEFFCNDHTDVEDGVVSVKGRTKGNESVHARSRDKGCRDLGEFRIGTPVTVFDIIEEWAEVDIGGSHCRMLAKYITVVKETASAE